MDGIIGLGNVSCSRIARLFSLVFVALTFSACSSSVERAPELGLQQPQFDEPGEKAGDLSVSLSSGASIEASENLKFSQQDFRQTIYRVLTLQDLISEQKDEALPIIEVTVTSVRVRSSFSAIMFGFLAGDDHIEGDVLVRAPDGTKLQEFSVAASYAWGGFAGGDETRMEWLYENFAERMAEELSGRSES